MMMRLLLLPSGFGKEWIGPPPCPLWLLLSVSLADDPRKLLHAFSFPPLDFPWGPISLHSPLAPLLFTLAHVLVPLDSPWSREHSLFERREPPGNTIWKWKTLRNRRNTTQESNHGTLPTRPFYWASHRRTLPKETYLYSEPSGIRLAEKRST